MHTIGIWLYQLVTLSTIVSFHPSHQFWLPDYVAGGHAQHYLVTMVATIVMVFHALGQVQTIQCIVIALLNHSTVAGMRPHGDLLGERQLSDMWK